MALKGVDFCKFHGGAESQRAKLEPVRIEPLGTKRFASRYLGEALYSMLEEQLEGDPVEQLQLFDELALLRITMGESLRKYNDAWEGCQNAETATEEHQGLLDAATALLQGDLERVSTMVKSAAYANSQTADKFSIHTFISLINQVVRIAHDVYGEENLEKFSAEVKRHLRMPTETEGTTITPDQDAISMNALIPSEPQ